MKPESEIRYEIDKKISHIKVLHYSKNSNLFGDRIRNREIIEKYISIKSLYWVLDEKPPKLQEVINKE